MDNYQDKNIVINYENLKMTLENFSTSFTFKDYDPLCNIWHKKHNNDALDTKNNLYLALMLHLGHGASK